MSAPAKREAVIFTEALSVSAGERAAFLDAACGGDERLRQRVEALLKSHAQVGDFLEESPDNAQARRELRRVQLDEANALIRSGSAVAIIHPIRRRID